MNNNSSENLYANLRLYLIKKLPQAPNNSDLELVLVSYHKFFKYRKRKLFLVTSEEEIFKLLKINKPRKEADLSNMSKKLLKNGAVVLAFFIKST